MRILRSADTPLADAPKAIPSPLPSSPDLPRSDPVFLQQLTAVMVAIAAILATRLLLLLASIGGFWLAYQAIGNPDTLKIAVCVVYDVGVILPIAYLYLRGSNVQADG